MSTPAIALHAACKRFGRTVALDRVSFSVQPGEVVGFVGPNGSGKSTTLRLISGFIDADSGQVQVAGRDVIEYRNQVQEMIGYMPEAAALYRDMRVAEYLRFRARLKGVPRRRAAERVAAVLADCGLEGQESRILGHLSKGFRQRVGLADALLAEPSILLLDEPGAGLDPVQVRELRALIRGLAPERTVVISSHVLPEIEAVAGRVIMLARGALVADGTPDELRARLGLDGQSSLEDVFVALLREQADAALSGAGEDHAP